MAETRCRACERLLDIEPVKCPYCQSVQPAAGEDRRRDAIQGLLALFLGGVAAFPLGLGAKRAAPVVLDARLSVTLTKAMLAKREVRHEDEEAFRRRVQTAWRVVESEGFRPSRIEDATVDAPHIEGARLALGGFSEWLELNHPRPTFAVCTAWGSGACFAIDASLLTDEQRREIQKNYFPPTNFLVKGTLRQGVVGNVPGAASSYHLEASDIVNLGKSPSDASTKTANDYLPHPVLN